MAYNYNKDRSYRPQGGRGDNTRPQQRSEVSYDHILRTFNPQWITNEIDAECVRFCEDVAKELAGNKLSSSFIRNVYGELKRIETKGFDNCRTDFYLLRPKVAYSTARSDKKHIAELFKQVYNRMADNVNDNASFVNLVRMSEAIIAYHKTIYDK